MRKPIAVITLAYSAGLLLGHGFLYFPYSLGVLLFCSVIALTILIRLARLSFQRFLLTLIFCTIGIGCYVYSAVWLPPQHYTRVVSLDKAIHNVSGKIISPLDRDPDRTGFVIEVSDIDARTAMGRMRVSIREAVQSFGYGDVIRLSGKIYEPRGYNNPGGFDYPAYLARSGIYRTVSVKSGDRILVLAGGKGIFRSIQDWRESIRQSFLHFTTGSASAILQAMVLGEEGSLTDDLREIFLAAGVTHIISISGSHLGMVAILCFGFVRLVMRLLPERTYHLITLYTEPRKIAALLTLPLLIFYTLLAGGQVATIRSLIMIAVALAALVLDRENALLYSLLCAALLILIAGPQALFDISFQLSFISVFSIASLVTFWAELGIKTPTFYSKLMSAAVLMIAVSLATTVTTGPVTAHYFNQISFAGIISNMLIVPFAGMVVVPLGLFSGILSLSLDHLPLAWLNQAVADLFIRTVAFFSRLPLAQFHPASPGVLLLVCYGVIVISSAVLIRDRVLYHIKPLEYSSRSSKGWVSILALSGLIIIAIVSARFFITKQNIEVSFPDVGQGDSELIELPSGANILIDGGGTHDNRFDIGRHVLAPYLWNRGIRRLDLVVLSHPQADHMNGLVYILKKFDVAEVWLNGQESDRWGYQRFMTAIAKRNITKKITSAHDPAVLLGGAEVRVLHPSAPFRSQDRMGHAVENDRSLVVRIDYEGHMMLFMGDIGVKAEKELVNSGAIVKCDLIKVPHHGSKSFEFGSLCFGSRTPSSGVYCGRGKPVSPSGC